MENSKRSSSVLFNKNANPFFPAAYPPMLPFPPMYQQYPPRPVQNFPGPGPGHHRARASPPMPTPVNVTMSNLPPDLSPEQLDAFLAAELQCPYSVLKLGADDAVVEFSLQADAHTAVAALDQHEWCGKLLAVAVNADEVAQSPAIDPMLLTTSSMPDGTESPHDLAASMSLQLTGASNPYFFVPPYPYAVNMEYGYIASAPMPFPPYGYYGPLPQQTRSPSRRLLSKLLSRQNSVGSYKPPPPFLLGMVRSETESELEDDGLIAVDDEDGNLHRVNPRRLFVGNIPFNSTWPALKNFLISKAEEIEPGNDIDILRVEIPMQQPRESPDLLKLNSYQLLTSLLQQLQGEPTNMAEGPRQPPAGRGLSRGFAIVTTANQTSLEKLIKYFDNVDFEGRSLTVRFDRFPDFNNYVLQQLFSGNKHSAPKSSFLTNMAVERNSFHHKFYYSNFNMGKPPRRLEISVDDLARLVGEIEHQMQRGEVSDAEKARELVNSFTARDT